MYFNACDSTNKRKCNVVDEKSGKTCCSLFSGKNPMKTSSRRPPAKLSEMEAKNVEKVAGKRKLNTFLASPSNSCTTQTHSECLTHETNIKLYHGIYWFKIPDKISHAV